MKAPLILLKEKKRKGRKKHSGKQLLHDDKRSTDL